MTDAELAARAEAWIDGDPDPETREELSRIVASGDAGRLRERLEPALGFGTAGLRGVVEAGPSRMNRAVVIRATRAVAEYLVARVPDAHTRPVVVGFDGRVSSRALAETTIGVLAAARIPVRYFADPTPTPVIAYALPALAATAAIVITASHNPGEYNGYKLYAENGAQIVHPGDQDIERRIHSLPAANAIPCAPFALGDETPLVTRVPPSLLERYLADVDAARPRGEADRSLAIVYTPMHGVGGVIATRALAQAGFSRVDVVKEQWEPDGRFPTARFPNPELAPALELARKQAERDDADLVLANDPDADRLAVCVPTATRRMVPLSGNQIGLLLADFLLARAPRTPEPLVLSSIVSSPMMAALAEAHGARFEQTLTGFKWIWNAALALERAESVRFAFGYEEAIGFSVFRAVRDKDGISAAVVFAELAAELRKQGKSVRERLAELYRTHGLWASSQSTATREGADGIRDIAAAVDRVGAAPPTEIDGLAVTSVTDFRTGAERRPPWLGATPLVVLSLGERGRVLLRPSGTEPKLKVYVDLRDPTPPDGDLFAAEEALAARGQALGARLLATLGF